MCNAPREPGMTISNPSTKNYFLTFAVALK